MPISLTISEFLAEFGAEYEYENEEYIRQMCRGDIDKRTGKRYSLPPGLRAHKDGKAWKIEISKRIWLSRTVSRYLEKDEPGETDDDRCKRLLKEYADSEEPFEDLESLEQQIHEHQVALVDLWFLRASIENSMNHPRKRSQTRVRRLEGGEHLLAVFQMMYEWSINSKRTGVVRVTFTSDGRTKIDSSDPSLSSDPRLVARIESNQAAGVLIDAWLRDLTKAEKNEDRTQSVLVNLCIGCGKHLNNQNSYCIKTCWQEYRRWIKRYQKSSGEEKLQKIASRLRKKLFS